MSHRLNSLRCGTNFDRSCGPITITTYNPDGTVKSKRTITISQYFQSFDAQSHIKHMTATQKAELLEKLEASLANG